MKKFLLFIVCALVLVPSLALAAEFRAEENGDQNIGAKESVKNLYVAGMTINSDADAKGDLVAAGQNVNINGSVEHSLIAAGTSINLKGTVGTTARMAGSSISVSGQIGEDLTAAGGTINLSKDSKISGDILLAGSTITLDGVITGKAWIAGNKVIINGEIDGDVLVRGVDQLTIGKTALIKGNLKYHSPNTVKIEDGAVVKGTTDYVKLDQPNKFNNNGAMKLFTGIFSFYTLLMTFLVLLALVYIFPRLAKHYAESSIKNFWSYLGWGFLASIVAPIATLILLFTITGAKVLGTVYVTALTLAVTAVPVLAGALIMFWIKKKYQVGWLAVLVGVIATYVLLFIPVLGWLALIILVLVSLGYMTQGMIRLVRSQR